MRKDRYLRVVIVVVWCWSAIVSVAVWNSVRWQAQYDQLRGRLLLIHQALTLFADEHGRYPLVPQSTLNDSPNISWRVTIAPYCRDISRKWATDVHDHRQAQPPQGWPFIETSSSMTRVLAVIRQGGPWSPLESNETFRPDTVSPDEVIAICCDDILVKWDSLDDAYWSGDELWIISHDNKVRIQNVRNCFVLRFNGVVDYYYGTNSVNAILTKKR